MTGVPWGVASRVARRIAGSHPLYESYHGAALAESAQEIVTKAERLVAQETRLPPVDEATVQVVDRPRWIEQNLTFFEHVIEPAQRRLQERLERDGVPGLRSVANRAIAAETGALLGFLSRKVLGQYELVLPSEEGGDTVYLVGPNILELERQQQFRPSEFRMWIALHETTHRLQFVAVPWMRDYFLGLVEELVGASHLESGRWGRIVDELREAARARQPIIGERGLFGLLASEEQIAVLDRVQALMSVLEGHGHVVMDRLGARELATSERMSRLIKQRRQDPRTAAFYRLTGLEMKMRQYAEGEQFVLGVEDAAGWEALDVLWQDPSYLPDLDEIRNPQAWLDRVA